MTGLGDDPDPYGPPTVYPPPDAPPSRPPHPNGHIPYPVPPYVPQPGYPQPGYPQPGYPQQWQPPPRPSFPHPEPRPFHLMFRTWTYAWWRPVVGIVLLLVGMTIVLPILCLPVLVIGLLIEGRGQDFVELLAQAVSQSALTPSSLLYLNLTLGALILWTWGLARVLHSMRPRWLSSVVPKLRWRFLGVCLALALVALLAQFAVGMVVPQDANPDLAATPNPLNGTTIALLVVMVLTTPLQAAGEEYGFRGYLLQAIGALAGSKWLTIVLTSVLFASAHLQFDPPLFFDRFMFGLIAAWLVIRTGGLEAGIALHVLNNFLAIGLGILFGDLDTILDPGDVSWWNVPVSLTQSLVYAALVAWVAARMRLQTHTRPPSGMVVPDVPRTPEASLEAR